MAAIGGSCLIVLTAIHWMAQPAPPLPQPAPPTFDVAALVQLDPTALAALRDHTVIVSGVIRERRHDSFLNDYVVVGGGTGYAIPAVQCFLADQHVPTPPPGAAGRFRARVNGMSLGAALQAEDCVLVPEEQPSTGVASVR